MLSPASNPNGSHWAGRFRCAPLATIVSFVDCAAVPICIIHPNIVRTYGLPVKMHVRSEGRYIMRKLAEKLLQARARYVLNRHSQVSIAATAKINYRGIARHPPSRFVIGDGSIFEGKIASSKEGSVVKIGSNTFVGNSTLVCANKIEIGDDVLISWGCTIIDNDSHSLEWADRMHDVREWYFGRKNWRQIKIAPIMIMNNAWIGFNSIIIRGVKIVEGSVVGCGSVVTRDVPNYTIVAGNPARVLRQLNNESALRYHP